MFGERRGVVYVCLSQWVCMYASARAREIVRERERERGREK
jgi:hypothetical protein